MLNVDLYFSMSINTVEHLCSLIMCNAINIAELINFNTKINYYKKL